MSQEAERRETRERLERLEKERQASFAKIAEEMDLKPFRPPYSRIWIEQDQEDKHYPTHFYSERYTVDEKPELKEHKITFPVDLTVLGETLDALNTLYMDTVNPIIYDREGAEGFMNFVKAFEEDQTLKQLEENKRQESS